MMSVEGLWKTEYMNDGGFGDEVSMIFDWEGW